MTQIYAETSPGSFAPKQIKSTIGRYGPSFAGYGQQDSQEFLLFLLDGLQEDLNRIQTKPYIEKPDSTDEMVHNFELLKELADKCWDIYKARNDSVITDLFAGMYKSTLVCPECDKVSIIFDPFNNLTLQLPIENVWQRAVFYFGLHKKPLRIDVDIDKTSSFRALKEYIGKKTGADPKKLIMTEVFKSKFYKLFDNVTSIAEANIAGNDDLCFYELEDVPTNYNPEKVKKSTFYGSSQKDKIPELDDPLCDKMLVPLFHRKPAHHKTGRRETFGVPSYIVLTREEAEKDYDAILRKVLNCVAQMTTANIFLGDGSSEGSDAAVMVSGETESSDTNVKASSVEGEESMVDVTMTDSDDKAVKQDSSNLTYLKEGDFIQPELRNLFNLTYLETDELIPLGYQALEETTQTTPLGVSSKKKGNKLFRKKDARSRPGVSYGGVPPQNRNVDFPPSDDEEVSDDELARPDSPSSDRDSNASSEALPSVSEITNPKRILPAMKPPGMPARVWRQRQKQARAKAKKATQTQDSERASSVEEDDELQSSQEADAFPLLKPSQAIVCDWNAEGYESLFEGESGSMRGMPTWNSVPIMPDPDLIKRRAQRASKKKRGISLDDCLDEFGKSEVLSENDAWYCPRCKEHRRASKKFELWKVPDILVIHLKRFSASRGFRDKLDVLVDFPIEGLDLTKRVALPDEGKEMIYDLIAVDNHYGSLGGGHYTAFAQNFYDKSWWEYNGRSSLSVF